MTAVSWPGSGSPGRARGRRSTGRRSGPWCRRCGCSFANWFVTEDHALESGLWVHDNIHISEACALVGEVPEVSKKDLDRIVRPEPYRQRKQARTCTPEVAPAAAINAANRLSPPRPDRSQWRERVSGLLRSTKGALHPAGDDHEATGTVYSKKAEGPVEIHPGVGHLV